MPHPTVALAYAPSGRYVACADAGSALTLWRVDTKEEAGNAIVDGDVLCLAVGPTNGSEELLAVGTSVKNVMLFTVPELDPVADLRHNVEVRSLAFSSDGR